MTKPYCIGSDEWNGLSKLIEEMGELGQVAGKIMGAEGEVTHFDGTDLIRRFEEEMGDVLAASKFVSMHHPMISIARIELRAKQKRELFEKWNQETREKALTNPVSVVESTITEENVMKSVRYSELVAGMDVVLDEGFTCMRAGEKIVLKDLQGKFYLQCADGRHYLDGQVKSEDDDTLVGIYRGE